MSQNKFRQNAWEYFVLHASQRLTTFNYYIVISTLITTGIFATFSKDYTAPSLGIAGGMLLVFFSFVFWKLDDRNRQIIKGAETALKFFEDSSDLVDSADGPHVLKLFTRDDVLTNQRKAIRSFWPWRKHYSYTTSFNWVFAAFAIFGVLGAGVSAYKSENLSSGAMSMVARLKRFEPTFMVGSNIVIFIAIVTAGIVTTYFLARLASRYKHK